MTDTEKREPFWRCGTCAAVYSQGDERPPACLAHVAPLSCAYDITTDGRYEPNRQPKPTPGPT